MSKKLVMPIALLLIAGTGFNYKVSARGSDSPAVESLKVMKSDEKNIVSFLATALGGLFPPDKNVVLQNYNLEVFQYDDIPDVISEAIERWNNRVSDLFKIVKKLTNKFNNEVERLNKVNNDIIKGLATTFKTNIYPALKNDEYKKNVYCEMTMLDTNRIRHDLDFILLSLKVLSESEQRVIDDVLAKLKKSATALEMASTKKARQLLCDFAEKFLKEMCKRVDEARKELSGLGNPR